MPKATKAVIKINLDVRKKYRVRFNAKNATARTAKLEKTDPAQGSNSKN